MNSVGEQRGVFDVDEDRAPDALAMTWGDAYEIYIVVPAETMTIPTDALSAAKQCARLCQRLSVPTVGLWQMCLITRTCRSRLISGENTSRPFLAQVKGTGT